MHGQAVFRSIQNLLSKGFRPDIVVGHAGWGETLFVKDALPDTPLLNYWEFFYNSIGQDVNFDPEQPSNIDSFSPCGSETPSRSSHPRAAIGGLRRHSGSTPLIRPGCRRRCRSSTKASTRWRSAPTRKPFTRLPNGKVLRPGMKIVTYVARNLEPYRGFHVFMRALPEIQKRHPDAEILIVGRMASVTAASFPKGIPTRNACWPRCRSTRRLCISRDISRPRSFAAIMQVSSAHIYLTYPFVLSWSMLEAMATGCIIVVRTPRPSRR